MFAVLATTPCCRVPRASSNIQQFSGWEQRVGVTLDGLVDRELFPITLFRKMLLTDVTTFKEWEMYLLEKLEKLDPLLTISMSTTGKCHQCTLGRCTRFCTDIVAEDRGYKLAIDAKWYHNHHISHADITKLVRDMEEMKAHRGVLIGYKANISRAKSDMCKANRIKFINVINEDGNVTHWKLELIQWLRTP
eukprot:TRINITY_DN6157_c0_g1_i1.p1 TRINITY_DN6157_c0_g1~~TRINITY_DN6157_c0_g1_i1.p1  ORF type:complete len:192 (+),score=20.56 TRINITY_DN6157_c0_g1_i1:201-776(+)